MIMIYFLYDILLFLAYLAYLPVYALRGRVHADILTRLGFIKHGIFDGVRGGDVVWIHAVSVGEARAAESLIRLIRSSWPKKRIVVSTVTPTGHAIVRKILKDDEVAFYAPLDVSFIVSSYLKEIRPSLLIIMETEIWPNLIRLTKTSGAAVVVVNGRISDRSFKRYGRMKRFLKATLEKIDLFCMQTAEAADRIIILGAQKNKVKVTGNIKFDISADFGEPPALQALKDILKGAVFMIAGSTHENEEEGIIEIYKSLRKDFPSLRLLIAPRHIERVDKIRRIVRLQGMEAVNISRLSVSAASVPAISSAQVLILDSVGDLNAFYSLCDVAYVGGSLVPRGGHNPIEPALFGKAIVFGRYMDNFREIRDIFIKEKAAIQVESFQSLEYELRRLLASPADRRALGDNAKGLIDRNRGAASRAFEVIRGILA
ncbi:MAG TPA: 3-deoxy-D-manno-octulosonic acid transferase [Candidatus Omnitrophica bacterium]|nr:3-deoxy-D-manno-octulosonic acid transferase [Candidatus Omnitrophota bacterium]